ncbi:hypothetical protein ACFU5O_01865 [Streptomyces sp. NPDC057445]|uniref:hypothetical protein n=1 Tax=Streptomyces sp. NPDC057445 TaxID=3346136 RepID=UPI0036A510BB
MRLPRSAAAGVLATLLLTGCGIQETDVIEAGGPATIQVFPSRGDRMLLFFPSPGGELRPVARPMGASSEAGLGNGEFLKPESSGPPVVSTEKTLAALFAGPVEGERAAGLTSGLPPFPPDGLLQVTPSAGGEVEAVVPVELGGLGATGLRQLICTVAYAEDPAGQVVVSLKGPDMTLSPAACDVGDSDGADAGADTQPPPTRTPDGR